MSNHSIAQPDLAQLGVDGMTRSAFLVRGAVAAGAVYGASVVSPFVGQALAQGGDVEILNFALTLEYLEAEFYKQGLKRTPGLSADVRKLATEIRDNEDAHVDALITAVKGSNGTPASKPTFDFGAAFSSEATFLKTANVLEDTGVSAYNGAGPLIKSPELLGAAGSIVQVEARHAALIRLQRNKPPAPVAFDTASDADSVLAAVKPFIKA
jgi:hypothetical protein